MNKFKRSLLPVDLRGEVIAYSGQYGSGKSLLCLFDPNNTVFFDADRLKSRKLAKQHPKMEYHPVNSDDSKSLVRTGDLFLEAVESINKAKTTVVVFDNLYEIEQGLGAYAVANPVELARRYNLVAGNISGKNYGHDTLAHERILKGVVDELLASNITVIITSHMKDKWMVPGQKEIKARKWVYEAASLVAILIRTSAAPDAIIFKNAFNYHTTVDADKLSDQDFMKYQRGELESSEITQRFPRRIPAMTTGKIARYLARTPKEIQTTPYSEEETLEESDIAPFSEMLSKWQLANVEKIMEAEEEERARYRQQVDNIRESQRAGLDQEIVDAGDEPTKDLIQRLKIKYEIFAAEITPIYIMKVRQGD